MYAECRDLVFVGTTMISMYAECGDLVFARKVFEEMWQPNAVTWNAIVSACFRFGDLEDAEDMFKRMSIRNLTTWNVMLAGYTKAGELELARRVFSEIPIKDDVSWSTMIVGLKWLMKVTQGNLNSCVVIPYWRPFSRYSRCLHHVLCVCKSIVYEEKNCTSIH